MVKTPICNSQIFLWKVMVTGYTESFKVQDTTIYFKGLGFTGVFWREGVQKPNRTKNLSLWQRHNSFNSILKSAQLFLKSYFINKTCRQQIVVVDTYCCCCKHLLLLLQTLIFIAKTYCYHRTLVLLQKLIDIAETY